MTVTIKIDGKIEGRESIQCELETPEQWKPSFNEFCKVKGALRMMVEKLSQNYSPPPNVN